MKPFERTLFVVASDHVAVGHVIAEAVCRLSSHDCALVCCRHIEHAYANISARVLLPTMFDTAKVSLISVDRPGYKLPSLMPNLISIVEAIERRRSKCSQQLSVHFERDRLNKIMVRVRNFDI